VHTYLCRSDRHPIRLDPSLLGAWSPVILRRVNNGADAIFDQLESQRFNVKASRIIAVANHQGERTPDCDGLRPTRKIRDRRLNCLDRRIVDAVLHCRAVQVN
jgi:hypothetical protein